MKKEWINYYEDWLKLYENDDGGFDIWYSWDYVVNYNEDDGFQKMRVFKPADLSGPELEELVRRRFGDQAWGELLEAIAQVGKQKKISTSQYNYVWEFDDGLAMVSVVTDSDRRGMIDTEGRIVIPPEYRELGRIRDERIRFQRNHEGPYGFMDREGKVVIPERFKDADDFRNGRARVTTKNGQQRLINVRGRYVKK